MEEQQQAVEAAGWFTRNWQWLLGTVVAPFAWLVVKNRERVAILESRVCDSAAVTKIVKEENKPIQESIGKLIDRMGEHNDNVTERMNQLSDTMTTIAMHIGPDGPRNRRGSDD